MVTITIDNSYSQITGLSAAQEKELRSLLSYTTGGSAAFFSGYGPRKTSLLDKKGFFPTGLIYRIYKRFSSGSLIIDNRHVPGTYPLETNPTIPGYSYNWQLEALKATIRYSRGIITAPTGSGKSRVISLISHYLDVKTLVIVPTLEIKKQLTQSILESLGPNHKVTVENIDSGLLYVDTDYDCLIIDEAHHVAAKTYRKLNKHYWNKIFYRYFLTATPFRNDTEETLLFESIAGQVIYQLTYKEAVKEKYIVPIESYYIEVPKQKTDAYTYTEVYKELVVNNTPRNVLISKLLTNLHSSRKSTLCLVKEVKHGKTLSEITGLPLISGEDESSRKLIRQFSSGGLMAVIATEGMMGEGVDTKACEYVIVAGLGKAKSQFMQKVGRAVRKYEGKESAKVIVFQDKSHKFTSRHYNAQRAILKEEYGSICQKLEIE